MEDHFASVMPSSDLGQKRPRETIDGHNTQSAPSSSSSSQQKMRKVAQESSAAASGESSAAVGATESLSQAEIQKMLSEADALDVCRFYKYSTSEQSYMWYFDVLDFVYRCRL